MSAEPRERILSDRTVVWIVVPVGFAIVAALVQSEYVLTTSENPNFWVWAAVAFAVIWSTIVAAPDVARYLRRRFPS